MASGNKTYQVSGVHLCALYKLYSSGSNLHSSGRHFLEKIFPGYILGNIFKGKKKNALWVIPYGIECIQKTSNQFRLQKVSLYQFPTKYRLKLLKQATFIAWPPWKFPDSWSHRFIIFMMFKWVEIKLSAIFIDFLILLVFRLKVPLKISFGQKPRAFREVASRKSWQFSA